MGTIALSMGCYNTIVSVVNVCFVDGSIDVDGSTYARVLLFLLLMCVYLLNVSMTW